jgi:hypothetical protein
VLLLWRVMQSMDLNIFHSAARCEADLDFLIDTATNDSRVVGTFLSVSVLWANTFCAPVLFRRRSNKTKTTSKFHCCVPQTAPVHPHNLLPYIPPCHSTTVFHDQLLISSQHAVVSCGGFMRLLCHSLLLVRCGTHMLSLGQALNGSVLWLP